jgi:hypothetical protein
MSGKGNCYDNAQAESFLSRFKTELIEGGVFEDIERARSEAFCYIEGYYNRVRLYSGLGYKSPSSKVSSNEKGDSEESPKSMFMVAWDRIELPTRGFSVRCSTN